MELIQTEQIRFNEREKNIINNAFHIINQLHEETTNYTLTILTEELMEKLLSLEEFYE